MAFNYSELDAVTEKYFLKTVVDQIFAKDAILNKIREKKKVVSGGRAFSVPIKVDTLNRGQFAPNTTFNVDKKEIINTVDLPVRGHYANLTIDGFEEAINQGNQAVINLLSEKLEDLEEAIRQELLDALYDPATAQGFIGLQEIIGDKNTYAGLNRTLAEHDYWRAVVKEDATGTTPIPVDYAMLRKYFMDVTNGGREGRNLVFVGDFGTVSKIEDILSSRNQITTVKDTTANLGFENFTLFGKQVHASAKLEEQAQASGKGILYALNFDYLTMNTMKGKDFAMTKFKGDRNSDLQSKQLIVMGNYVCTKPKTQGVIKDIEI